MSTSNAEKDSPFSDNKEVVINSSHNAADNNEGEKSESSTLNRSESSDPPGDTEEGGSCGRTC